MDYNCWRDCWHAAVIAAAVQISASRTQRSCADMMCAQPPNLVDPVQLFYRRYHLPGTFIQIQFGNCLHFAVFITLAPQPPWIERCAEWNLMKMNFRRSLFAGILCDTLISALQVIEAEGEDRESK